MDKDWERKNRAFESFYSRLTGEYKGKYFEPTPGIAGYIDDQIVTPMMLRRMDEAYSDHLAQKRYISRMIPMDTHGALPQKRLADQQVCPGTICIDRQGDMTVVQTLQGSHVVRIVAEWNNPALDNTY